VTFQEPSRKQLSTADFATADERSQRVNSDDSPEFTGDATVAQTEKHPVVRTDADRVDDKHAPLFLGNEAERFRNRWTEIQTGFVDEPRTAVEQADSLVAEIMQRLAQVFADERSRLERRWDRSGETDTEELRQALQRYRSFFDRLLAM
jgi:hypothetical protein